MMKEGGTFRDAQFKFAKYMGVEDFRPYRKGDQTEESEKIDKEPDEPVSKVDAEDLTDDHRRVMQEAALFYSDLLLSREEKFKKVIKYLESRDLDRETIKGFQIGFSPPLEDDEFRGRALLNQHIERFIMDVNYYQLFRRASLLRLLNDENAVAFKYYRRHIDNSGNPYGVYSDYFLNRITFPVHDIEGRIEGIVGRRLDNRRLRWLKQTGEDTYIKAKGWLYGIDKSAQGIREYKTVIIVEGIFDFFAFYNISVNREKPIVVSTLGTLIEQSSIDLLVDLGASHFIVAFDWDPAGQRGILKAAESIKNADISFLGSLREGEDPADKLKGVVGKISNFGIRHLQNGMKQKSPSGKPVMASFLVQREGKGKAGTDEILFKPAVTLTGETFEEPVQEVKDYWYREDDILPLLSYDHKNRLELDEKLTLIQTRLENHAKEPSADEDWGRYFRLPMNFIGNEIYIDLGDALILHLRIAIEQQKRKRRLKESDNTIAEWLGTSRRTVQKYKNQLKEAGLLNIMKDGTKQKLSVRYFIKDKEISMTKE